MDNRVVKIQLCWGDVQARANFQAEYLIKGGWAKKARESHDGLLLYGVPRGGIYAALLVQQGLNSRLDRATSDKIRLTNSPDSAHVIIDDIIDSGKTQTLYGERYPHKPFIALVDKDDSTFLPNTWVEFPWETANGGDSVHDNIRRILQYIGEDPDRPGLRETPDRVVRALGEFYKGYKIDDTQLYKVFEDGAEEADEVVIVKDIDFVSMCEHHMLPFHGRVHIGYLPDKKILGLSKFARVVEAYSRRLQVQERLTNDIAFSIQRNLKPKGVAVVIQAQHSCMCFRGVMKADSTAVTSKMLGVFRDKPEARAEFMALINQQGG